MSATTAPTPRVSILDGGGKSGRSTTAVVVRCDGMVRTRSDITMVVHVVGMVLFTIIIICRKGHGRSIRFSRLLNRDDANFVGCGTVEHAADGLVVR